MLKNKHSFFCSQFSVFFDKLKKKDEYLIELGNANYILVSVFLNKDPKFFWT